MAPGSPLLYHSERPTASNSSRGSARAAFGTSDAKRPLRRSRRLASPVPGGGGGGGGGGEAEQAKDGVCELDEIEIDADQRARTPTVASILNRNHTFPTPSDAVEAQTDGDEWQPQTPPLPPHEWASPAPAALTVHKRREETDGSTLVDVLPDRGAAASAPSALASYTRKPHVQPDGLQMVDIDVKHLSPTFLSFPPQSHLDSQEVKEVVDERASRKSLFDIEDAEETQRIEEMYALLTAAKKDVDSDLGADSDESDAAYEARRNRKVLENQRLLAQLGLGPQEAVEGSGRYPESPDSVHSQSVTPSKVKRDHKSPERDMVKTNAPKRRGRSERKVLKLAEDGTTTALPLHGTVHEVAYVDVLPVRDRVRVDFLYLDDFPVRAPTPTPPSSPVTKPYQVLASGSKKSGTATAARQRVSKVGPLSGASPSKARVRRSKEEMAELDPDKYFSGTTCHQCRRKTVEPKMRCRQIGFLAGTAAMQCLLQYCQNCCLVRYGIGDETGDEAWDVEHSAWACPRCRGFCNCSLCMYKADLSDLIPQEGSGSRAVTLSSLFRQKAGRMKYRSVRHYLEQAKGVTTIGPSRILSSEDVSQEFREINTEIARLKAEVSEIKERRRRRMASQSSSLRQAEGEEQYPDDDAAADEASDADMTSVPPAAKDEKSRPRLIAKLRKRTAPGHDSMKNMALSSTMAAIAAWQSFRDDSCTGSSATDVRRRQTAKAYSLAKRSYEARESQVWIKGAADRYESDTDDGMEGESEQGNDYDDRIVARSRTASNDSTLTSLSDSDIEFRRQGSVSLVTEAEVEQEGSEKGQGQSTKAGGEAHVPQDGHLAGAEGVPQVNPVNPPLAFQHQYEENSYRSIQVDASTLELRNCAVSQVPQLTHSSEYQHDAPSSSSSLIASPWIKSPYSAKGQGPQGVDASVEVAFSAPPHFPSPHIYDQQQGELRLGAAGELGGLPLDEQQQQVEGPLDPTSCYTLQHHQHQHQPYHRHSPMETSHAPSPRQMFFSPSSSWQKTRS